MKTFPIEISYIKFNSSQPYLDLPSQSYAGSKIGTLIEYKPGKFGLVAGLHINEYAAWEVEDIHLIALHGAHRIKLKPVIICTRTNLVILEACQPEELAPFHTHAVALADDFVVKDAEQVSIYQKDLKSQKEIMAKVKIRRFRFESAFCFSLPEKIVAEEGLSSPGPVLNKAGKLIGYMINPSDKYVISSFHIQYLLKQLATDKPHLFVSYPLINFELMDLTSANYHLYLPDEAVDKKNFAYGCSIQNCPTYPNFPFQRGDILLAVDGKKIKDQQIEDPLLGEISITAAPLLSNESKLVFTLYRHGKEQQIVVDKTLFSKFSFYLKNKPKFIIMNGIVFQAANSHLYDKIESDGSQESGKSHSLSKSYRFLKEELGEVILITETLTNATLFNSSGTPFPCSPLTPFILKKMNGERIINLEILIQRMAALPIGTPYNIEGITSDLVVKGYGIKISDKKNQAILTSKAITKSCSEDLEDIKQIENITPSFSSETLPICLYRYNSDREQSKRSLSTMPSSSAEFSIERATMRGMMYLHTTRKIRSPSQPYQFNTDIRGAGSGFVIRYEDENYIITCAHVLGYTKDVQIKAIFPELSKDFNLEVVMVNNDHDIAILKIHPDLEVEFDNLVYPFYIDDSSLFAKTQSDILVIGFPSSAAGDKTNPKTNPGKIATIGYVGLQAYTRAQNALVIQTNAATSGGNSGGPVIDAKTGRVVSIHSHGHSTVQLTNFSKPVIFLRKMLKMLKTRDKSYYPVLPGIPFDLSFITDRKLKKAHGIEPDSLIGAKINALYSYIPDLEINDILLELIDKEGQVYPVNGKGCVSIEENDISYRVFFELQEVGDPISIKILRNGKEHLVHTQVHESWPLYPQICSTQKDRNHIPSLNFCEKLLLTNFDVSTTQAVSSNSSLTYYSNKLQKQDRQKSTKVAILEILPGAREELSSWIIGKKENEILFLNTINGIRIHSLDDVAKIVKDSDTQIFTLDCRSSQCSAVRQKFVFNIKRNDASADNDQGNNNKIKLA